MQIKPELARPVASVGTEANKERVVEIVSPTGNKIVSNCLECGGPLRYQSFDPCEGYYYRCAVCGDGPYGPYDYVLPMDPACRDCDRIVCAVQGTGVIRCRELIPRGILQRTLANTPPNEAKIRGCE